MRADRRQHLEDLPSVARDQTLFPRGLRDRVERTDRLLFVVPVAEMECDREPLQLDVLRRPRCVGRERGERSPPAVGLRLELEPVRTDADDAVHAEPRAHVVAGATAHDGDERVPPYEPLELGLRLRRRHGVLGPLDDRRENAVEVEEQPSRGGLGRKLLDSASALAATARSIGRWRVSS